MCAVRALDLRGVSRGETACTRTALTSVSSSLMSRWQQQIWAAEHQAAAYAPKSDG
jgi:hypothetical protein